MSTVFISYRRNDVPFAVEQLERHLEDAFGSSEVFRDTSDIQAGVDFHAALLDAVASHDALLVVIGPDWHPERLHVPNDYVRAEILAAFGSGKAVIPVVVGTAGTLDPERLPSELASLARVNYLPLRPGTDLTRDLETIVETVARHCPITLTGTMPGRVVFGRSRIWCNGLEVANGLTMRDLRFGPLALRPGLQRVRASVRLGPTGPDQEFEVEIRRPGAWHIRIDYRRVSGKLGYELTPPDR